MSLPTLLCPCFQPFLVSLGPASLFSAIFFCSSQSHTLGSFITCSWIVCTSHFSKRNSSFRETEETDIHQAWINCMLIPSGTWSSWHLSAKRYLYFKVYSWGNCILIVKWHAQGSSAGIIVWQNLRDMRPPPIGSLGSLENPGLLCSETSLLRSATDLPMWTPTLALSASSQRSSCLKLLALSLLLQAPSYGL